MDIRELFTKDLFRPINGVVKVDQKDDTVVWQELDEYVVTRELSKHINQFFSTYLATIDQAQDPTVCSRMGVWVSGFFGSGKSHFIKILSYLLKNVDVQNSSKSEKRKASSFFDTKISDHLLLSDIKRAVSKNTDVILFNIDSKADNKEGREAILRVFMRVFNEMQGFSGDYPHIAEMERYLAERDLLDRFQAEFKDISGNEWLSERDAFLLMKDEITQALSNTLGKSLEAAAEWFDKAESTYSLSIERFAKQVKEYLERKGPDHRVIFIVDEVGQFIGSNTHLMLDLQTIAEDLGRICNGRAWVIVTSQEDIDAVLGEVKGAKANDFSKIQGRFYTRLSLSSSNTDEVIQIRLLEKTPEAEQALEELFNKKGEILKNQLSFTDSKGMLKSYKDKEDFIKNYPFVPYHFHLVQKIFESIRKVGATGLHLSRGERSMLDAFQSATKIIADQSVGALVPLYALYPSIESFLDTSVKRTIDQASGNTHLKDFDCKLLQLLFLIRYIEPTVLKPNIDNIVTLCINTVDADRLALKRQIEESLQLLERENLVNRNGDLYYFLTNEERDISREIKNVEIVGNEQLKKLTEIIYDDILKGENKHRYQPNKRDYGFNRLCDGQIQGKLEQTFLTMEFISPLSDDYHAFNQAKCVTYSSQAQDAGRLLIKLGDSKELGYELRIYLQTEKYVWQRMDTSAPESFKKILNERKNENNERKKRIVTILEKLIQEADFYALGQLLPIKVTATAQTAIREAQEYLVKNTYAKLGYLTHLHDDPLKETVETLKVDDIGQRSLSLNIEEKNAQALRELRDYINLCSQANKAMFLLDITNKYASIPYGWPENETVLLVARLFVAGEISLMLDGATLKQRDAINPLTKSNQWKQVKILKHKAVEPADLTAANKLGNDLFSKFGPDSEEGLATFLTEQLKAWQTTLDKYKTLADTGNFPGKNSIGESLKLLNQMLTIQDRYEFFKAFNQQNNDLLNLSDTFHELKNFYEKQRPTWDKLKAAMNSFKNNQIELERNSSVKEALEKLQKVLEDDKPYSKLRNVDELIKIVASANETLVKEKQVVAITKIEEKIAQVKKELEPIKNADVSNQALRPLQEIKLKIQTEQSIPAISHQLYNLDDTIESSLEVIHKASQKDTSKSTKYIYPTKLVGYIETEEQAKHFLDRLKQDIEDALKTNARVKIC